MEKGEKRKEEGRGRVTGEKGSGSTLCHGMKRRGPRFCHQRPFKWMDGAASSLLLSTQER